MAFEKYEPTPMMSVETEYEIKPMSTELQGITIGALNETLKVADADKMVIETASGTNRVSAKTLREALLVGTNQTINEIKEDVKTNVETINEAIKDSNESIESIGEHLKNFISAKDCVDYVVDQYLWQDSSMHFQFVTKWASGKIEIKLRTSYIVYASEWTKWGEIYNTQPKFDTRQKYKNKDGSDMTLIAHKPILTEVTPGWCENNELTFWVKLEQNSDHEQIGAVSLCRGSMPTTNIIMGISATITGYWK